MARVVTASWFEGHVGSARGCVKIGEVVLFRLSARLVCWAEERGDYWEVFCLFAVLHVHDCMCTSVGISEPEVVCCPQMFL